MERMVCGTTPQHVYNTATNTCRRMPQPLAHMHTKTHAHTHAQIQHTHKHMHTPTQEHAHIQAHTHAHTPSVAQPQRKRSGCDPNTITAQLKTIHQNDTTPQQTATHRETDASQETRVHTNQAHTHTAQRQQTQTHTHNLHQPQPSAHPAEAHTYSHTYTRTHTHTLAHTRTHTPRIAASLNTDRPRTSPTASVDVCDCVGDNSELTVTGSALLLFIVKRDVWFKLRRCCDEKRLRRHVDTLLDTPFLARACRRLVGSDWYMGPVAYWQCAALQDRILADTLQAIVGLLFQSCDINQCARVFAEWCLVDEEELRVLFISPSQRVECIDRTKGIDNRVSELAENLGFKRSELLDLALKQDGE
ncbi:hypothetical protein SARC_08310 [Sphaeroforma arctica JP610]|uniref:RNase III domain-containing protein n=1 Tax=Sphaeroforma arctica JP610 TaxID=667725 RepID=A0A0L0FRH6_9EUKA|nr:hypothetical protein SARC_08310 [Sphaeroforma arctica JP610]KNC79294.1 hypothetical protein SARC_08310 [Sphaeroforma arctica JP610]|eukprot:XP_014153196.1 hypothetical protein SARC_08310 [Sphaeroforma arctica JP610]